VDAVARRTADHDTAKLLVIDPITTTMDITRCIVSHTSYAKPFAFSSSQLF
jgi:hypothetical protein